MTTPREAWLLAAGSDRRRQYLVHAVSPVFIGEVLCEPPPGRKRFAVELPDGRVLTNIKFLDAPPDDDEMDRLAQEAARALARFDVGRARR